MINMPVTGFRWYKTASLCLSTYLHSFTWFSMCCILARYLHLSPQAWHILFSCRACYPLRTKSAFFCLWNSVLPDPGLKVFQYNTCHHFEPCCLLGWDETTVGKSCGVDGEPSLKKKKKRIKAVRGQNLNFPERNWLVWYSHCDLWI